MKKLRVTIEFQVSDDNSILQEFVPSLLNYFEFAKGFKIDPSVSDDTGKQLFNLSQTIGIGVRAIE